MKKLVLLQTVATDNRKFFFDTLKDNPGDDFLLYAGDCYFTIRQVNDG